MFRCSQSKFRRIILIVGKTGVGKSSLGNCMSNSTPFQVDSSSSSITKEPEKAPGSFNKNIYEFIDTPELYDTDQSDIIGSCVNISVPGPHVFLFVISIASKFTNEDYKTYKKLKEIFGDNVFDYMVLVFTCKKRLGKTSQNKYIQSATGHLKEVLEKCSWRYVFIECDVTDLEHTDDVTKVYEKIEEVIEHNKEAHYTNEMYKKAVSKKKWDNIKNMVIEYGAPIAGDVGANAGSYVACEILSYAAAAVSQQFYNAVYSLYNSVNGNY